MVFVPPTWAGKLPLNFPDSITVGEFMKNEHYGRRPLASSKNPYTCGLTGKTYTAKEVVQREDFMARAIAERLRFDPAEGTEWDRVVAIFSFNTIDYIPLTHAIHRLSGMVTPASAAYSALELEQQIRLAGAKALFTCVPLLYVALEVAKRVGIDEDRIFILPMPGFNHHDAFPSLNDLVAEGQQPPKVKPLNWSKGQGRRQVAYLCFSSGTSGLPKAVMISHYNVISNLLQTHAYNQTSRAASGVDTQITLGLLPFSHIFALVAITRLGTYAGDEIIVLPRFEFKSFLSSIQRFGINQLSVVPPILIRMLSQKEECAKYDLSTVRLVFTGAAPLGAETSEDLKKSFPSWCIMQGMTETSTVVSTTSELDVFLGSSGCLIPGIKAKLVGNEGNEITTYDTPETFVFDDEGRWIRTGDEALVRKSPKGNEHIFIVDRIKELIKVKGHQVAPAELEAHLVSHPYLSDCAVIQVPDDRAGEVLKAFVVKSREAAALGDEAIIKAVRHYVKEHNSSYKCLAGGIEFIDAAPKSPSGKILRRLLRDREKQRREREIAKL